MADHFGPGNWVTLLLRARKGRPTPPGSRGSEVLEESMGKTVSTLHWGGPEGLKGRPRTPQGAPGSAPERPVAAKIGAEWCPEAKNSRFCRAARSRSTVEAIFRRFLSIFGFSDKRKQLVMKSLRSRPTKELSVGHPFFRDRAPWRRTISTKTYKD